MKGGGRPLGSANDYIFSNGYMYRSIMYHYNVVVCFHTSYLANPHQIPNIILMCLHSETPHNTSNIVNKLWYICFQNTGDNLFNCMWAINSLACKGFRWFCYIYALGKQIWLIKLGREANKVWKTQGGLKVVKAIKQQIPWDLSKSSHWAKIDHPVFVKERTVYKTSSRTLWKLHVYHKCINSPLGKLFFPKVWHESNNICSTSMLYNNV